MTISNHSVPPVRRFRAASAKFEGLRLSAFDARVLGFVQDELLTTELGGDLEGDSLLVDTENRTFSLRARVSLAFRTPDGEAKGETLRVPRGARLIFDGFFNPVGVR